MHEVSIMEEAVRMAVDAAKSAGASRVLALRLRVGALSGAVPEALRFAFDVVCRDTIAEGASLEMETVPAAGWCPVCRAEFAMRGFHQRMSPLPQSQRRVAARAGTGNRLGGDKLTGATGTASASRNAGLATSRDGARRSYPLGREWRCHCGTDEELTRVWK